MKPKLSIVVQDWTNDVEQVYKVARTDSAIETAAFILYSLGELIARCARELEKHE
jgi:hypothetical protein